MDENRIKIRCILYTLAADKHTRYVALKTPFVYICLIEHFISSTTSVVSGVHYRIAIILFDGVTDDAL